MAKPTYGAPVDEDMFEVEDLDKIESKYLIEDGPRKLKVTGLEKDVSSAGNKMWVWEFTIVGGKDAGKEFKMWTALTAGALWKLEQVLVALGLGKEGASRVRFSKSDAIGRYCMGEFISEKYKGRLGSKIDSVSPLEDDNDEEEEEPEDEEEDKEEEEEEEEEPPKPAKKTTTKKKSSRR